MYKNWRELIKPKRLQVEADCRVSHRQALQRVGDMIGFGAVGFEKLEPCGRGEKQIAHLDPRALTQSGRLDRADCAAVYGDGPGAFCAGGTRRDRQSRDGADRRQSLAAKSKRVDVNEVLGR